MDRQRFFLAVTLAVASSEYASRSASLPACLTPPPLSLASPLWTHLLNEPALLYYSIRCMLTTARPRESGPGPESLTVE